MRRAIVGALAILLVLGAAGAAAFRFGQHRIAAPGPLTQPRAVLVPHGSPAQLGEALQQAGVIGDAREFRLAALLTRGEGPLHAAEFSFPAAASLRQVLDVLRQGHPVEHLITIPEGLTAAQIALLLDHADALGGPAPVPDEGALLPQTYAYEYGASRAAIADRAGAAMQRALAQAWDSRAPGLPLASPQDLLILASIVERETARPEERPHIAAVFLNRLRLGMKLQSDPTAAYAASGGMETADPTLSRAALDLANPYNTYRAAGLPPGPIGSPGIAALAAVARPAASDDLYFVADGSGGHVFARTLEEHNRNVAHWREQRREGQAGVPGSG